MNSSFKELVAYRDRSGRQRPISQQALAGLQLSLLGMCAGGGTLSPVRNHPGSVVHSLTVCWTIHKCIRNGIVHNEFTKVFLVKGSFGKVGHVWRLCGVLRHLNRMCQKVSAAPPSRYGHDSSWFPTLNCFL